MSSSNVVDLISLIYSFIRAERDRYEREKGVIWVTDLVRCPLKRVYEDRYPDLVLQEIFKPSLIIGTLVHRGLENLLRELVREYSVETEVEGSRDVILDDGSAVSIRGRLDMLLVRDFERVAVEIKSSRSDKNIPQKHHVDQVRAYNWLMDLSGSILLYVTPARVTQFYIEDRMDDSEVVSRVTSKKAPRYSWECSYCIFSVMCPYKIEI
ncbi:MAG: CRISPR-associated protein Cas4 [Sulfolobales archaeon]|nr:CRISPR-associated protein Cas4 [Sulfolobales archaeon]MDW8083148.1 CRISPR-associated protein Cas4 [Sulfolobales archaeon]